MINDRHNLEIHQYSQIWTTCSCQIRLKDYNKKRHVYQLPFLALLCCLLMLSSCALSPLAASNGTATPTITHPSPTPLLPTPTSTPLTDSDLATSIVRGMTLDEKLGQMVIVEFYGSTLNN